MKIAIAVCSIFVVAFIFFLGLGVGMMHAPFPETEYIEVPVEVPTDPIYIVNKVINETRIEYAPCPGLREFGSPLELRGWLASKDVCAQEYKESSHDCDDFAVDLAIEGMKDGYIMGIYWDKYKWHYECWTLIDGKMWLVEPQHNTIRYLDTVD